MQIQMQCNVKLTRTASTSKSCVFGLPPGCSPSTAAFEDAHPMAPGADHGNVCADAFRVLEELCARPARAADIDATQFSESLCSRPTNRNFTVFSASREQLRDAMDASHKVERAAGAEKVPSGCLEAGPSTPKRAFSQPFAR